MLGWLSKLKKKKFTDNIRTGPLYYSLSICNFHIKLLPFQVNLMRK